MASCLPFYGMLNLSVRVHQINLHSLVDRINALLTSTRFLSANEDWIIHDRARPVSHPALAVSRPIAENRNVAYHMDIHENTNW